MLLSEPLWARVAAMQEVKEEKVETNMTTKHKKEKNLRVTYANARAGKAVHGATALYLAAQNGHLEIVRRLVDAGAAVDARLRAL